MSDSGVENFNDHIKMIMCEIFSVMNIFFKINNISCYDHIFIISHHAILIAMMLNLRDFASSKENYTGFVNDIIDDIKNDIDKSRNDIINFIENNRKQNNV